MSPWCLAPGSGLSPVQRQFDLSTNPLSWDPHNLPPRQGGTPAAAGPNLPAAADQLLTPHSDLEACLCHRRQFSSLHDRIAARRSLTPAGSG